MKPPIAIGCAIMVLGTALHSQPAIGPEADEPVKMARPESYRQCNVQDLEPFLLVSLDHETEGVVADALREVGLITLAQGTCWSDRLVERVDELALHGTTPLIRTRAFLTSMVIMSPVYFASEGVAGYRTDRDFFTGIARRMETLDLRNDS